jgi:hypothetical protein
MRGFSTRLRATPFARKQRSHRFLFLRNRSLSLAPNKCCSIGVLGDGQIVLFAHDNAPYRA